MKSNRLKYAVGAAALIADILIFNLAGAQVYKTAGRQVFVPQGADISTVARAKENIKGSPSSACLSYGDREGLWNPSFTDNNIDSNAQVLTGPDDPTPLNVQHQITNTDGPYACPSVLGPGSYNILEIKFSRLAGWGGLVGTIPVDKGICFRETYTEYIRDSANNAACSDHLLSRQSVASLPILGYQEGFICGKNKVYSTETRSCQSLDLDDLPYWDEECCEAGNPVGVVNGDKRETISLYQMRAGPRNYPIRLMYANLTTIPSVGMIGDPSWRLDPIDRRIERDTNVELFDDHTTTTFIRAYRPGRDAETFEQLDPDFVYKSFIPHVKLEQIESLIDGVPLNGWRRTDYKAREVEIYRGDGRLKSLRFFEGGGIDLVWNSTGQLISIIGFDDESPTSLDFEAEQIQVTTSPRANYDFNDTSLFSDPQFVISELRPMQRGNYEGQPPIALSYDRRAIDEDGVEDDFLSQVTFEDGSTRNFTYEPASFAVDDNPGLNFTEATILAIEGSRISLEEMFKDGRASHNLKTIIDETGATLSTFTYNTKGRTIRSERAGGVNRVDMNFTQELQTTVTSALGGNTIFAREVEADQQRPASTQQITAGTDSVQQTYTVSTTRDAAGFTNSQSDNVNGLLWCSQNDAVTGLPLFRVDNPVSGICPTDLSTYVPQANSIERKTTLQYTARRLEKFRAEPKRISILVYNGEPDPTNNDVVRTCAPATATLPNGDPIAVLCKSVVYATTDETGALGAAAAQFSTRRITHYTYNADGQITRINGPRTGVEDITTFEYYTEREEFVPPEQPTFVYLDCGDFPYDGCPGTPGFDPDAINCFDPTATGDDGIGTNPPDGCPGSDTYVEPTPPAFATYYLGDLKKVTNAVGHVTHYDAYFRGRLPAKITLANGSVLTMTYHPRGWLTSSSLSANDVVRTRSIQYYPTGKVQTVTEADGSVLTFTYDTAQRLTSVTDSRGLKVTYTLDFAGNRVSEDWTDVNGTLRGKIDRAMDSWSRVRELTGYAGASPFMPTSAGPILNPQSIPAISRY